MIRRVIAAVFLLGVMFYGLRASSSASPFSDAIKRIFGYVPLQVDSNVVAIALCNRTDEILGVEMRYAAPGQSQAKVYQFEALTPLKTPVCNPQAVLRSWFPTGIPARVTIAVVAGAGAGRAATVTLRSGLNGATFGAGAYCTQAYDPPPDPVDPAIDSAQFVCLTVK